MPVEERSRCCICLSLIVLVISLGGIAQNYATQGMSIVIPMLFFVIPAVICIIYEMRKGRGIITDFAGLRVPPSTPAHVIEAEAGQPTKE
ncbi:hypothetical protein EU545_04860 [Candidatus Thorarchaeota archaeon]|nr:MAG: hypothetical protein EU545_04860 [Candidatus Thorarchaeota archaeon]